MERFVATIGFFDGVHKGHRYLIQQVKDEALKGNYKSLIITFDNHPRKVLDDTYKPSMLSTFEEKYKLLEDTGIDNIVAMEFTRQLSMLTAKDFMQIIHDKYCVDVLIIGYDHKFGHNRSEGFDDYVRYGQEIGIRVIQAQEFPDAKYSSTAARQALINGDVEKAEDILGYKYS
ncbi:MAG: FAD synthetase family protein, partial [Bacteroidaceae bacterium]|nr:FAD synthetase family protein [Bacteroidaceae bacterium]